MKASRELSQLYISDEGLLKHRQLTNNCYIISLNINTFGIMELGYSIYKR